jgi:hypothetical protein
MYMAKIHCRAYGGKLRVIVKRNNESEGEPSTVKGIEDD